MNFWLVKNVQIYYNRIIHLYQLSRNFMPCCPRSIKGQLPKDSKCCWNRGKCWSPAVSSLPTVFKRHIPLGFKSLPKKKILDQSEFKVFADDISKRSLALYQMTKF